MKEPSKQIKRALRELAGTAHEVELTRALGELHEHFSRWERNDITAFDLTEAIHRFHEGPARDLYNRYNSGLLEVVVAHAIVTRVLDRGSVAPEVLEHLAPAFSFYKSQESA